MRSVRGFPGDGTEPEKNSFANFVVSRSSRFLSDGMASPKRRAAFVIVSLPWQTKHRQANVAKHQPRRRGDPRALLPRARPRLRVAGRLHGHRRVHRARGARQLRLRHAQAEPDARPAALPAPAQAHHAQRDGRAEVPLLHAHVHRAPVDPPPHRQRERDVGALLPDADAVLQPPEEQLQTQSAQNNQGRAAGAVDASAARRGGAALARRSARTPSRPTSG